MSEPLERVRLLVGRDEISVSLHGFRELAADSIRLDDAVAGLDQAVPIEDYPTAAKGPSVLVLQRDKQGRPIHIVWGVPKGSASPAVLITAYRPDPERWSADFMKQRTR